MGARAWLIPSYWAPSAAQLTNLVLITTSETVDALHRPIARLVLPCMALVTHNSVPGRRLELALGAADAHAVSYLGGLTLLALSRTTSHHLRALAVVEHSRFTGLEVCAEITNGTITAFAIVV